MWIKILLSRISVAIDSQNLCILSDLEIRLERWAIQKFKFKLRARKSLTIHALTIHIVVAYTVLFNTLNEPAAHWLLVSQVYRPWIHEFEYSRVLKLLAATWPLPRKSVFGANGRNKGCHFLRKSRPLGTTTSSPAGPWFRVAVSQWAHQWTLMLLYSCTLSFFSQILPVAILRRQNFTS